MNRIQTAAAATLLCCPCALADPVFFDDFDGDDLKPWWDKSPPNQWTYTVANSLLSVTQTKDSAAMSTKFDQLGDIDTTAAMGWEASDKHTREFIFGLFGMDGALAAFSFNEKSSEDLVVAWVPGGGIIKIPAPPAGIYDFTILRVGGEFHFLLDNSPVATFPDVSGDPITGVFFNYSAIGTFEPLLVDRVQVIPAPSLVGPGMAAIGASLAQRRRS